MSQVSSLSVENANGLAVRTGFNALIAAVNSQHSGSAAPAETVPYMMWADTSSTPAAMKMRNAANDGWLLVGTVDEASGRFVPNGQIAGRNLIINGSGRVNQRGYVSGTATGAANAFTLDRWFVQTSGQSLTFTGNDSRRTMTAPSGGVATVIRGNNILAGTYVLNWTGTATATVAGVPRAKGEIFTLNANTNVKIEFIGGTFTDVQLEAGSVPTPFEQREFGEELHRCQRFYTTGQADFRGYNITGQPFGGQVPFKVNMDAPPAMSIVTENYAGAADATFANIGTESFLISATATATAYGRMTVAWRAVAEVTT